MDTFYQKKKTVQGGKHLSQSLSLCLWNLVSTFMSAIRDNSSAARCHCIKSSSFPHFPLVSFWMHPSAKAGRRCPARNRSSQTRRRIAKNAPKKIVYWIMQVKTNLCASPQRHVSQRLDTQNLDTKSYWRRCLDSENENGTAKEGLLLKQNFQFHTDICLFIYGPGDLLTTGGHRLQAENVS